MSNRELDTLHDTFMKTKGKKKREAMERLGAAMLNNARRIISSRFRLADEALVQDIATTAFVDMSKFEGRSKFSTWFYTICCHRAINHKQEIKNGTPLDAKDVEDSTELDFRRLQLNEIVDKLNEDERLLVYHKLEGMTEREIGNELGLSLKAVNSRWSRLMTKMQSLAQGVDPKGK